MGRINETMLVNEVLDLDDDIASVFAANGLPCLGCLGAASESLAEAAEGHGVNLPGLIADLNRYLDEKNSIE